ncbi:AAA family ATPase [Bradyrhizobium neotropicale]|uniref:AAA family ATPase n=1 Tax=Bradyrhizobium neotropicale TaxID=1497615 RepID=UPI001FED59C9|nr:AAA family ATPase [Bradyrhizobium neotropicale]
MIGFSRLTLSNWRQFDQVDIDLSKQVTVLTGQNGSGKTTILNLLNRHFGWSLQFVSTPYYGKKTKRFWSDIWRSQAEIDAEPNQNSQFLVGRIEYTAGGACDMWTTTIVKAQYQLQYQAMQHVDGLYIPSHRPVATYNAVGQIPTDPTTAAQSYQQFQSFLAQAYGGGAAHNPGRIQKQSIISLAVFGEGNSSVQPDAQMRSVFDRFQEILRRVMPPELGFHKLEVRMPEVVCVTESGDFSLDAMSGGVNALFSIAWQIHMFGHDKQRFVITIDEPENHLHPSMQRTLLPSLAAAFPNCSIIAATHSPFIVSSFPDANVYALGRGDSGRIVSQLLDTSALSRTPNDVLREILDVHSNLPVWVERQIAEVIESTAPLDARERARIVMEKLERLGFAEAIVEYKRGDLDAAGH